MRTSGWRRRPTVAAVAVAALVVSVGVIADPAAADPRPTAPVGHPAKDMSDGHAARDKDNRFGSAAPTARQRSVAGAQG